MRPPLSSPSSEPQPIPPHHPDPLHDRPQTRPSSNLYFSPSDSPSAASLAGSCIDFFTATADPISFSSSSANDVFSTASILLPLAGCKVDSASTSSSPPVHPSMNPVTFALSRRHFSPARFYLITVIGELHRRPRPSFCSTTDPSPTAILHPAPLVLHSQPFLPLSQASPFQPPLIPTLLFCSWPLLRRAAIPFPLSVGAP